MNYDEAVDYLYARLPMFTRDGASAFKKDLTNTYRLCEALGNPHERFKSIHIAGTNGKGSTSHMLAAILQQAGYKTGLYTSPHLLDFRERIRTDGTMIPQAWVAAFVHDHQSLMEHIRPSFFEVTVAMAFAYFAEEQVDVAVVETGLGGRLDSTNIITPLLSIITNIGYDHTAMLGGTLPEIAGEKAGIIKPGIPVVVSERQEAVAGVFERVAAEKGSRLVFASDQWQIDHLGRDERQLHLRATRRDLPESGRYALDLRGSYQAKNLPAVRCAVAELQQQGFDVTDADMRYALTHVQQLTGLMGRWQTVATDPTIVCDTGHNVDGWREVLANIAVTPHETLHVVIGMMRDKEPSHILPLLPKGARYYFCQVAMPRALPAEELRAAAGDHGLTGDAFTNVAEALTAAKRSASAADFIFIGGSTFIVADALVAEGFRA
ncbi:bifunctional folylpolyglutamate synthase/dihydrofolate synthase [Parapedobacter sp. 10938]|uniref:bifunctional folylpolyglutamate synthase/dihydrofolate synthase n=1 Tax=Parapedobacter flavus TaxID=3110225 RepID=UPI002DBC5B24|nr:folylpolyglutamate synthase/dihydrofolate synthase family protein [Parapedobacter sp. 10938]MEC3879022.1 folylpolyglutamate synthase/dihydrofolate synthase family protein [Parapedobacter sp. 10938]